MMANNEDKKCKECGSIDFSNDVVRGEISCNDCGLVSEHQIANDVGSNSSHVYGENASSYFNSKDTLDQRNRLGAQGHNPSKDFRGVNPTLRRALKIDQKFNKPREKHPFTLSVFKYVKREFGENTAHQAMPLIKLACYPLSPSELKMIKDAYPALKKRLKLPKNVFCHGKEKGADQKNIAAIGLACVELLFQQCEGVGAQIDQKLVNAGISKGAVSTARRNITAYWKGLASFRRLNDAAVLRGEGIDLFPDIPQFNKNAVMFSRDQEIQNSISNLTSLLEEEFTEALSQDIARMIYENLAILGEGENTLPTTETSLSATSNLDPKMLVAIVCFSILRDMGISEGLQAKVASMCGQSGPGLSMALKRINGLISAGKLPYKEAFRANNRE